MKEPVQYADITDNEVEFYKEMGYLCLPGFVDTDALDALREDILVSLESNGVDRSTLFATAGSAGKLQQCHRYYKDSALDSLINSPRTLHVASRLLGGLAIRYLPFTAVKAGGGGQFHLHQDNNYTRHHPASGSLNIWVAMVEMTPDNGCLQMIPRSHLGGTLASENAGDGDGHKKVTEDPSGVIPIRMRAGDAVAFSRLAVHGSGPNSTDEPRIAYALQYHREDVQYEDPETGEVKRLMDDPRWDTEPVYTY